MKTKEQEILVGGYTGERGGRGRHGEEEEGSGSEDEVEEMSGWRQTRPEGAFTPDSCCKHLECSSSAIHPITPPTCLAGCYGVLRRCNPNGIGLAEKNKDLQQGAGGEGRAKEAT